MNSAASVAMVPGVRSTKCPGPLGAGALVAQIGRASGGTIRAYDLLLRKSVNQRQVRPPECHAADKRGRGGTLRFGGSRRWIRSCGVSPWAAHQRTPSESKTLPSRQTTDHAARPHGRFFGTRREIIQGVGIASEPPIHQRFLAQKASSARRLPT